MYLPVMQMDILSEFSSTRHISFVLMTEEFLIFPPDQELSLNVQVYVYVLYNYLSNNAHFLSV